MKRQKSKCHVYCQPCEYFGICPHSFKEYDDYTKRQEAIKEYITTKQEEDDYENEES